MEQNRQQEATTDAKHVANERDLAGAGGGSIPLKAASYPSKQQPDESVDETVGRGVENDTDTAPAQQRSQPGAHATPGATNASDQPGQGSLGGRTPEQTNQSIGDRDQLREHRSIENTPIDPMTSRAPDKVNQKQKQKQEDKQKQE